MLNKIWDIFMTDGNIIYTNAYTKRGVDYVDNIVKYRKKLYYVTIKETRRGFDCINISEIEE